MPIRLAFPDLPSVANWALVAALTVATLLPLVARAKKYFEARAQKSALQFDSSLIKGHTTLATYTTPSGHTYSGVRTFYHKHVHADELPVNLPLLVFVHGLGGSIAQFQPLLNTLVNVAPCLALDLPGCGGSYFSPSDVEAYTTVCLAEVLHSAIDRFRNKELHQQVIFFGHSYGCSIASLLTSSTSPLADLCSDYVLAMIAICPRSSPLLDSERAQIKWLQWTPVPVIDAVRMLDRRGGIHSISVERMTGKKADDETRKLQLRFNQQSRSAVWKTMVLAMALQEQRTDRKGEYSLLSQRIWEGIKQPLLLISAKDDTITRPEEAENIVSWVQGDTDQTAEPLSSISPKVQHIPFKSPASHSLLFSPRTIRSLSGHIETFLASDSVDPRLSQGWQLGQLTTLGRWDVKNVKKWRGVAPCSAPIASIFRALKTMRQTDDVHSPKIFVSKYGGQGGVKAVVDISSQAPVYNKDELEDAGIQYHKFPTQSKEVPTLDNVSSFCALIDQLREEFDISGEEGGETIGVHCHYGYNRTGFLIIAYMIEKLGWKVRDAVAEFQRKRPPGIKHPWFIDQLHARYDEC